MDCTSKQNGGENDGCGGGLMEDVFEYAETHALPYENENPYRGEDAHCRAGSVSSFVSSYATMSSDDDPLAEEHLAWLITHYGPVAVSIDSRSDAFQNYAGGIFPGTMCGKDVDHAVVIVGFGPGYWIVKNSWGKAWEKTDTCASKEVSTRVELQIILPMYALYTHKMIYIHRSHTSMSCLCARRRSFSWSLCSTSIS